MKFSQFLASLVIILAMLTVSILTMIYGWGLHPRSWWWIIGCGLFGVGILRALLDKLEKEIKNNK